MAEWIAVEDGTPETGFAPDWCSSIPVLVWTNMCYDAEDAMRAQYHDSGEWLGVELEDGERVTHWHPYPDKP